MATTPVTPQSITSWASEPKARTWAWTSSADAADGCGGAAACALRQAFSTSTGTPVSFSSRPNAGPSTNCRLSSACGSSNSRYPWLPARGPDKASGTSLRNQSAAVSRSATSAYMPWPSKWTTWYGSPAALAARSRAARAVKVAGRSTSN